MQTLQYSYRGLGLLMSLNWDRALSSLIILVALIAGAWIGVVASESGVDSCAAQFQACSPFSSF